MSTNRNEIKAKIRAALAGQTTGLLAGEIRERGEIPLHGGFMAALLSMQARGEVLKHKGDSPKKSRYTLNPEQLADAPPQRRNSKKKAAKKPGRKSGKKRAARTPAAPEPSVVDQDFVPALTVDHGMVLVGKGVHPPMFFSPEETAAIATLLGANFTLE